MWSKNHNNNSRKLLSIPPHPLRVKAIVTVLHTKGGALSLLTLGLSRRLDDISDLLGRNLIIELVPAELHPKSGDEKPSITSYAYRARKSDNETRYETTFDVPGDFGEIGVVAIEHEHRNEKFVKNVVFEGFTGGSIVVTCNSWIHTKFEDPEKRIFFANKCYLPFETPSGLIKYKEKELIFLRSDGQGERKNSDRIYDYDVYNDLGDLDNDNDKSRPIFGGADHPYPRRCRIGRPKTKKGDAHYLFVEMRS